MLCIHREGEVMGQVKNNKPSSSKAFSLRALLFITPPLDRPNNVEKRAAVDSIQFYLMVKPY